MVRVGMDMDGRTRVKIPQLRARPDVSLSDDEWHTNQPEKDSAMSKVFI